MHIFEKHIEANQRLQKVGLFINDSYLPEELDIAFNKSQDRFIQEVFNNKFQDTELKNEVLRTLVVKNKQLDIFGLTPSDVNYEANAVYSILPSNFYLLINDRSTTIEGTTTPYCNNLGTIPTTTKNESISILAYPTDTGAAPFYENTVINDVSDANGTTVLYTAVAPLNTFSFEEEKYVLINDIIQTVNSGASGIKVYWERYRNTYSKNSFIFVADSSKIRNVAGDKIDFINVDGTTSSDYVTTAYTTIDAATLKSTIGSYNEVSIANKMVESEELYKFLNSLFYKTKSLEPISNKAGDFIYIYYDKNFIVSNLHIDYIRKPRIISLSLNQSCELPETAQQKILDMAVELMKLDIGDQTYQLNVGDTELRNQK